MLGPKLCRCRRCDQLVEKRKGSTVAKVMYWGTFVSATPIIPMLFLTGPGVFMFAPMYVALVLSGVAAFQEAAYPHPACSACGASLDNVPVAGAAPDYVPIDELMPLSRRPTVS